MPDAAASKAAAVQDAHADAVVAIQEYAKALRSFSAAIKDCGGR